MERKSSSKLELNKIKKEEKKEIEEREKKEKAERKEREKEEKKLKKEEKREKLSPRPQSEIPRPQSEIQFGENLKESNSSERPISAIKDYSTISPGMYKTPGAEEVSYYGHLQRDSQRCADRSQIREKFAAMAASGLSRSNTMGPGEFIRNFPLKLSGIF